MAKEPTPGKETLSPEAAKQDGIPASGATDEITLEENDIWLERFDRLETKLTALTEKPNLSPEMQALMERMEKHLTAAEAAKTPEAAQASIAAAEKVAGQISTSTASPSSPSEAGEGQKVAEPEAKPTPEPSRARKRSGWL